MLLIVTWTKDEICIDDADIWGHEFITAEFRDETAKSRDLFRWHCLNQKCNVVVYADFFFSFLNIVRGASCQAVSIMENGISEPNSNSEIFCIYFTLIPLGNEGIGINYAVDMSNKKKNQKNQKMVVISRF